MALPFRVLVTRAPHQGSDLAERLRASGLEPVLIPAIEIAEPSSFAILNDALSDLGQFQWIVFTSANAVTVFAGRWNGLALPGGTKVAAIGPSTAQALVRAGLAVDLVPSQAVAESLAEALLPHARRSDGRPTRMLLVRAEEGREHLPETLRGAGAEVTVAPAYRTVVASESVAPLRALIGGETGQLAAITFTSSSTVRNLLALCEAGNLALPEDALRVSIGPITSATMRELGWPPHAEAQQATVAALAEAVVQALHERGASRDRPL